MPAKLVGADLDFQKVNRLIRALLEVANVAGDSPTPTEGQLRYSKIGGVNRFEVFDGAAWVNSATDSVLHGGQSLAAVLSRANHTGTQLSSTISDLVTTILAQRLDQLAAPIAAVGLNGQRITGLGAPVATTDAASRGFVEDTLAGITARKAVRVRSATVSVAAPGATVDGVAMVAGDRVLRDAGTADSGIYVWNGAAVAMTRATDADTNLEIVPGLTVFVSEGTASGNTNWQLTTDAPITLGTTALVFAQTGAATMPIAGAGLTLTGTTLDVGAGTGILVAADSVGIDTAVVARKAAFTYGDGAAVAFTLNHNFGTRSVRVEAFRNATPWDTFDVVVERPDINNVTIRQTPAPAANGMSAVVVG